MERIELNEKHPGLRLVLAAVFLLIGGASLAYGVSQLFTPQSDCSPSSSTRTAWGSLAKAAYSWYSRATSGLSLGSKSASWTGDHLRLGV